MTQEGNEGIKGTSEDGWYETRQHLERLKVGILVKMPGGHMYYTKIATDVAVLARHSFDAFSSLHLEMHIQEITRKQICFIWILDLPSSSVSNRASGKQVLGSQAPSPMDQALILWEEVVGRSFPLCCRSIY
jgi:hypothetical protein